MSARCLVCDYRIDSHRDNYELGSIECEAGPGGLTLDDVDALRAERDAALRTLCERVAEEAWRPTSAQMTRDARAVVDRVLGGDDEAARREPMGLGGDDEHDRHGNRIVWPDGGESLDGLALEIAEWQAATFEGATREGAAAHLEQEAAEIRIAAPDDVGEEIADAFFMIVQCASLAGVDLISEVRAKLEKNRARKWPKAPDARGVFNHIEDGEA